MSDTTKTTPLDAERIAELRASLSRPDDNGNVWLNEATSPEELLALIDMLPAPVESSLAGSVPGSFQEFWTRENVMSDTTKTALSAGEIEELRALLSCEPTYSTQEKAWDYVDRLLSTLTPPAPTDTEVQIAIKYMRVFWQNWPDYAQQRLVTILTALDKAQGEVEYQTTKARQYRMALDAVKERETALRADLLSEQNKNARLLEEVAALKGAK